MSHTVNRLAADKFIIISWKYKFEARTLHPILFSIKSKHMHTESIIHWGTGCGEESMIHWNTQKQ